MWNESMSTSLLALDYLDPLNLQSHAGQLSLRLPEANHWKNSPAGLADGSRQLFSEEKRIS